MPMDGSTHVTFSSSKQQLVDIERSSMVQSLLTSMKQKYEAGLSPDEVKENRSNREIE